MVEIVSTTGLYTTKQSASKQTSILCILQINQGPQNIIYSHHHYIVDKFDVSVYNIIQNILLSFSSICFSLSIWRAHLPGAAS